jgi:hypothetical protein
MLMLDLTAPMIPAPVLPGGLTESNAIDIWIARWLQIRRKDILVRYGCDPRRLYDIWEGRAFPRSRDKALEEFSERFPMLRGSVDTSLHRRIPRPGPVPGQPMLFDELPEMSCRVKRR